MARLMDQKGRLHEAATPGEQKPSEHLSFGVGYGFIVTATNDGSIPLSAKALAKIEPGADEAIREMQRRANAYPRLVEALRQVRDRTYTDAEGPELRAQNEQNYRRATELLRDLDELGG